MLQMRPNCECCNIDLAAESDDAWICSFECTFCTQCVELKLHHKCPNCGGNFTKRPTRVGKALKKNPASSERIYKPQGCT
ncbi:MAG: DUF1272 domain-containing protein [Arenimonas sp.]